MRFLGFHRLAIRRSVQVLRLVRPEIAQHCAGRWEGRRLTAFMQPDTAVIVRQRLLENAEDVDALFVLAALHAHDGLVAEGITVLDRVLRLDPAYSGACRFTAALDPARGGHVAGALAADPAGAA